MEEKTWTVYCHTNKVNGKMYIGITSKENPKRRWLGGGGYKRCPYFDAAIKKYGWDGFAHEVLETGLTEKEASEAERLYIDFYDTNKKNKGYNIQPGGISAGGMSEEGKESLRAHNIGLNANKQRPVVAFDLEGNRIAEFQLISFAAEHFGIKRGTLVNHLRKPRGTCHGMIFKYAEDVEGMSALTPEMLNKALYKKPTSGKDNYKATAVAVFDRETGSRICDFPTIVDAKAFCGGDVMRVLTGKQKTCGGKYICRYANDVRGVQTLPESELHNPSLYVSPNRKRVLQYSKDGVLLNEYNSLTEAANTTALTINAISLCAKGKTHTSGGFVWRFTDSDLPFETPTTTWETRRRLGKTNGGLAVDQIDLKTGEVLRTFHSLYEAANVAGTTKRQISEVCRDPEHHKHGGGFGWQFHKE